ncbi:unnamed protein product (macronuclear) [Paramecium tetraurelia]|uniref:Protein kinase domain-containing protein n=1 Tax=Paramecium tetraurelia TaxID=5888 RepID=A0BPV9_PARTE|nr:uncharacterized protein GSPATT00005326001 [Paramecium tetraurelia]CAK60576.1 unnamed protein product [Paramecium tetraurelia]|eukprot:XP_001427974.1 hypothetical protein (macronuclear) [Paramecium tetraurelia strain d4-2]
MEELEQYYQVIKVLGAGGFGKVVEAVYKDGGKEHVAILPKKDYKVAQILSEAQILAKMNHPNIVQFKNVRETESKLLIEMALIKQGPLKVRKYTQQEARIIMTSIFKAVQFIHEHGVVHRDLKPENILIVDFGLSAGQIVLHGQCGTLIYMAPELFSQRVYSKPIDIWSCGIILYQMLTGKHPLYKGGEHSHDYKKKLLDPKWDFPEDFDPMAKHLFLKCVSMDPIHRYSANQILQHPWITNSKTDPIPLTLPEMYRAFTAREQILQKIKTIMLLVSMKGLKVDTTYLMKQSQKLQTNTSNLLDKDYIKEMLREHQALKENQNIPPIKQQLRYEKILQRIQENGAKEPEEKCVTKNSEHVHTNENSQPSSSQKSLNISVIHHDSHNKDQLYIQTGNKHHFKKRLFKKTHQSDKKRLSNPFEIPALRSRSTTANHKTELKQVQPQHFESPKKPISMVRPFKQQFNTQQQQQQSQSPIRKPPDIKNRSNSSTKKLSMVEQECVDAYRFDQEKVVHSMFMPRVFNKKILPFSRNFQQRLPVQPQSLELNVLKPPLPKKLI